jgi:hypothetical protein
MSAERVAPQNLAAEETVLGAILTAGAFEREANAKVVAAIRATGLQADDFYRASHGQLYRAALALDERGKPTDAILLADELGVDEDGRTRLHDLAALVPATANAAHYARLVVEAAGRREEAAVGRALRDGALNGGLRADDELRQRVAGLLAPQRSADDLAWLERASDLLNEPDPGPTPFLVDRLIVEAAILALVGSWKVAKTWVMLELTLAVVTGRDAFDAYAVAEPGPVILVLEESGRDALHRRLDCLRRGYGLKEQALAELHFSANRRVRLNDPRWQERLLAAAAARQPRAIFLDPFVRLKGAEVNESDQREIGPVLDFLRDLRDQARAAVGYASHTGHEGRHQRGSSDFEGYWVAAGADEGEGRRGRSDHRGGASRGRVGPPVPLRARLRRDHPLAADERDHERAGAPRRAVPA